MNSWDFVEVSKIISIDGWIATGVSRRSSLNERGKPNDTHQIQRTEKRGGLLMGHPFLSILAQSIERCPLQTGATRSVAPV